MRYFLTMKNQVIRESARIVKRKKMKTYRNKKYLAWVKSLPSVVSGKPADDAHHIKGYGMGGMGLKAPDWAVIPLTREEHTELHSIGRFQWEQEYGNQWRFVAETLGLALEQGILK